MAAAPPMRLYSQYQAGRRSAFPISWGYRGGGLTAGVALPRLAANPCWVRTGVQRWPARRVARAKKIGERGGEAMVGWRYWRACVLAAVVLLATGTAQAADCAALKIRLSGIPEAAGASCSGGGNASYEAIDASGPQAVFVITHQSVIGTGGDYLVRLRVTELLGQMTSPQSMKVERSGEPFEIEDFDVIRYRQTMNGVETPAACFIFMQYAGHVAQSTGYRHVVYGNYCDLAGKEPDDARIGQLLGAIDADFW
jgi:hypothetical protein